MKFYKLTKPAERLRKNLTQRIQRYERKRADPKNPEWLRRIFQGQRDEALEIKRILPKYFKVQP